MDPNLFHLDWNRVGEVLIAIVIMSFLVERALAVLFGTRLFVERTSGKGIKELIAFIVGVVVCLLWDFDAVSMIFLKENVTWYGAVVTGGVVAGGSKASIKLFRDWMGFRSSAEVKKFEESKRPAGKQEPGGN